MFITAIPTIDGAAHTSGDAMGGMMTFDLGSRGSKTFVLEGVEILDDASSPDSANLTLHLFTDPDMAKTDNAAFTVSQADYAAGKLLASIDMSSYAATPVGTNTAAVLAATHGLNRFITTLSGKIYGQLVDNGGYTIADGQLVVGLHIGEYE